MGAEAVRGRQVHPSRQRHVDRITESPSNLYVIINPIETEHLPACPIRHIGGVPPQGAVLCGAGGHVVGIAFEGIAGLKVGIDVERDKGVVTRGNRQRRTAVEVGCWGIAQAVERGIDIRGRTTERHGAVGGTVAGYEGQARRAGERQGPIRHGHGDFEIRPAGVGIGNRDLVSIRR